MTYFFAATAYNASSNESAYSEELAVLTPLSNTLDHFAWGPISSPQTSGVPFNVSILAKDISSLTVTSFVGTVQLSSAVAITPTNSAGFVNGVWTGSVTVLAGATNLTLTASDGQNHSGTSAAFRSDVRLTVNSAKGGASPGTVTTNYGAALSQRVTNSPVTSGTTQYVCWGAAVLGNAFTAVSPTNVTLTLTNNATLTWQWATNYYLTLGKNGAGTLSRASGWCASGTNITVTATPSANYHFAGWTGNVQGDTNGATMTVSMNQAQALTANFATDQKTLTVNSAWGGATPGDERHDAICVCGRDGAGQRLYGGESDEYHADADQ